MGGGGVGWGGDWVRRTEGCVVLRVLLFSHCRCVALSLRCVDDGCAVLCTRRHRCASVVSCVVTTGDGRRRRREQRARGGAARKRTHTPRRTDAVCERRNAGGARAFFVLFFLLLLLAAAAHPHAAEPSKIARVWHYMMLRCNQCAPARRRAARERTERDPIVEERERVVADRVVVRVVRRGALRRAEPPVTHTHVLYSPSSTGLR